MRYLVGTMFNDWRIIKVPYGHYGYYTTQGEYIRGDLKLSRERALRILYPSRDNEGVRRA